MTDSPASTDGDSPGGDDEPRLVGEPGQWWPTPPTERVEDGMSWWEADPRIPSPEEAASFRPAEDLFLTALDSVIEATVGRPLRPRVSMSPAGLLRGRIDQVKIELPAYAISGLVVDRFIIRAHDVRVQPGLPPVFVAEPVELTVVVGQDNIDRWIADVRLPFRLRLTEEGILTTTGIRGLRMTEVLTVPDVVGGFVKLQPRRVSLLGVPAPMTRFLRGYLPLPPLPRSAKLDDVVNRDGEMELAFRIDRFEQPLTPEVQTRLARLLRLPLPGLR